MYINIVLTLTTSFLSKLLVPIISSHSEVSEQKMHLSFHLLWNRIYIYIQLSWKYLARSVNRVTAPELQNHLIQSNKFTSTNQTNKGILTVYPVKSITEQNGPLLYFCRLLQPHGFHSSELLQELKSSTASHSIQNVFWDNGFLCLKQNHLDMLAQSLKIFYEQNIIWVL